MYCNYSEYRRSQPIKSEFQNFGLRHFKTEKIKKYFGILDYDNNTVRIFKRIIFKIQIGLFVKIQGVGTQNIQQNPYRNLFIKML
jgi:hypothetical protein